jgi:hypothetical protein
VCLQDCRGQTCFMSLKIIIIAGRFQVGMLAARSRTGFAKRSLMDSRFDCGSARTASVYFMRTTPNAQQGT